MKVRSQKSEIRRQVIERIMAMDVQERHDQEATLHRRFGDLPGLDESRTVLLYISAFPEEFDTRPLLQWALDHGKQLVLPKVDTSSKTLHLYAVADPEHDLEPGHRGISEPSVDCKRVDPLEVDWVLVPGLAFNSSCHRLGRGAGHYDRLLPTLRPEVPRWALILEPQWVEDLPIEPHDQPLDGVADSCRQIQRDRQSTFRLGASE
jgi:5-formyltetrahydrofolate cyclo-ligase